MNTGKKKDVVKQPKYSRIHTKKRAIKGYEIFVPPHITVNGKYRREHFQAMRKKGTTIYTEQAEYKMQEIVNIFVLNVNFVREYLGFTWSDFDKMLKCNGCAINYRYYYRQVIKGEKNSFPLFNIVLICTIFKCPVQIMMFEDIREHTELIDYAQHTRF